VALSGDGGWAVAASNDQTLKVWDLYTGALWLHSPAMQSPAVEASMTLRGLSPAMREAESTSFLSNSARTTKIPVRAPPIPVCHSRVLC
jgi:WD40 repeat protein